MSKKNKPLKIFEYKGSRITFDFGDGNNMINGTEMLKAFPQKRMGDFLRLKQTKAFIKILEDRYGNSRIDDKQKVVRVVKGGLAHTQGT